MLFSRAYMLFFLLGAVPLLETHAKEADVNIESLLASMSLADKIGQMMQVIYNYDMASSISYNQHLKSFAIHAYTIVWWLDIALIFVSLFFHLQGRYRHLRRPSLWPRGLRQAVFLADQLPPRLTSELAVEPAAALGARPGLRRVRAWRLERY